MASSKTRKPAKPKAARETSAPESAVAEKKARTEQQTLTGIARLDESGRSDEDLWTLRLYVAGDSPKSRAALANLQRLCDTHLSGKYKIEVIDLKTRPELAKADQILALPTLIRKVPEPMKRLIGDLSNSHRAMIALELDGAKRGAREASDHVPHAD
jgi:circadian clock protein KaiB